MADPRNANGARRRAVRARVLAEESLCHICGAPVDKTLGFLEDGTTPHPMRPEVDEVFPVSRGGSPYDRSNCRLAHRRCNQVKGDKVMVDAPDVEGPLFPLLGKW